MRKRIVSMILNAEYGDIENQGSAKLYTLLTQDIGTLSNAVSFIPTIIIDASILFFSMGYILYLSPYVLLLLLLALILGTSIYILINHPTKILFEENRKRYDNLFHFFNDIIYGNREYKHNVKLMKNTYTIDFIHSSTEIKKTNLKAQLLISLGDMWGRLIMFTLLGTIVYILPTYFIYLQLSQEIIGATVIVIIFSLGSIYTLVGIFPLLNRASIAHKRVNSLSIKKEDLGSSKLKKCNFIKYKSITYAYKDKKQDMFHIGPISLTVNKGDIVFIVGGNGSGKTTLLKLLTGIHPIDSGSITCENNVVSTKERHIFRQQFSVLWNDCYLFERMLDTTDLSQKEELNYWLEELEIKEKITFTEKGLVNHAQLSSGQKKRLSLLVALLANKDYIVLDEWAAEQSPDYKHKFYREILPKLKSRGTGIVIVSHDSNYYDVADHIYKMENGVLKHYQ